MAYPDSIIGHVVGVIKAIVQDIADIAAGIANTGTGRTVKKEKSALREDIQRELHNLKIELAEELGKDNPDQKRGIVLIRKIMTCEEDLRSFRL